MLCRHIRANGIHPIFAFIFLVTAFIFLSHSLYNQSGYGVYLYAFFPLTFLPSAGAQRRNEFLQITFTKQRLRQLRMTENFLIVLPFSIYLVFKQQIILSAGIIILALLISFYTFKTKKSGTIRTPFYRFPFEFLSGFRKTFIGVIISYALLFIGIYFTNFNLSVVAMAFLFLIIVTYYTLPESEFFIWVFSKTPRQFLSCKIKIALTYSLYFTIPAMVLLILFFSRHYLIIAGIFVSGLLIVITSLLGKYALYPSEVNLAQTICIIFSVLFPPLMIVIIPILYFTSLKRLKPILE